MPEFHRAMGQPQVSVVIPVWNGERYLREAIASIIAQSFRDFELIVVDDGSTDGSAEIAGEFANDPRVSVIRQTNAGVVSARNAGLRAARAELVAFLDSDDIARPNRLAKQVAYLNSRPEIGAVGSYITYFDGKKGPFRTHEFPVGSSRVAEALEAGNPLAQPAVMLRKSMAIAVGGYREAFKFGAEDYDLWLRLSEKHPLDNLAEVLTLYRIHPDSLTHRRRHEQTMAAKIASIAHRRRRAGLPDPLNGLMSPLSPADLSRLSLSEVEEAILMPSLIGLLHGQSADMEAYGALARRAWGLRRHIPRGQLVRHCIAPTISALRKAGRTGEAMGWFARAFVTEPLSSFWMLFR